MIKNLNRKEVFFAQSEDEALDLIDERRDGEDGDKIVGQKIQQKVNKSGEYWLVELQYKFNTPAGIMESEAEDEEDFDPQDFPEEPDEDQDEEQESESEE